MQGNLHVRFLGGKGSQGPDLPDFNELIKIYYGDQIVDDIDDLKNRRLRTAGELIQTQFATGLIRLEKFINEQINQSCLIEKTLTVIGMGWYATQKVASQPTEKNPIQSKNTSAFKNLFLKDSSNTNIKNYKITIPHLQKLFNVKPINGALQEFFGLNPLSQFMDQTNPLAEITHKRRLTSLGLGGVERETAGMAIRGIHPTHYGRICPIETPEGQNAGLVNSITTHGYADVHGYLKTPFYKIYKGQVQRELGPLFLSSEQEHQFSIVPGDIFLNAVDILPGKTRTNKVYLFSRAAKNPVKYSFDEGPDFDSESKDSYQIKNLNNYKKKFQIPIRYDREFKRVVRDTVNYMIISPIQMISIATSLIPFLEHDDANRALMGSNMQRQAVSLIYATRPIVGTGLESRSVSDSGQTGLAPVPGIISYVSSNKVSISSINIRNNDFTVGFKFTQIFNSHQFSSYPRFFEEKPTKGRKRINLGLYKFMENYENKSLLNNTQIFASYLKNHSEKGYFLRYSKIQVVGCYATQDPPIKPISIRLNKFISTRYLNWVRNNRATVEVFKHKQNEKKLFYNKINFCEPIRTTTLHFNYFNTTFHTKEWNKKHRTKNLRCYAFFNDSKRSSFIVLKRKRFSSIIKDPTNLLCSSFRTTRTPKLYQKAKGIKNKESFFSVNQNHTKILNRISTNYMNKNLNVFDRCETRKINNAKSVKGYFLRYSKIQVVGCYATQDHPINFEKIKKNQAFLLNNRQISYDTKKQKTQINVIQNSEFGNIFQETEDTNDPNKLIKTMKFYDCKLQNFSRSNQDTFLKQSAILTEGNWVQMNDLLADNSTSIGGELALGQNIIVAYLPWEGYNFEDAILISERLVYEDIYTSLHIERYEIEIRETDFGWEQMTNHICLSKDKKIPLKNRRQKKIKTTKAPAFLSKEFKNKLLNTFNSNSSITKLVAAQQKSEIKNNFCLLEHTNNSNRIRFDNYSYLLTHKNIPVQFTGSSKNSLQVSDSDHFVGFNQTDKRNILLPFISSALITKKKMRLLKHHIRFILNQK